MNTTGVLVSCSLADKSREVRCSGILLDKGWVITTGCILSFAIKNIKTGDIEIPWKHIFKKPYPESLISTEETLFQNSQITFSVICQSVDLEGKGHISAPGRDSKFNPLVPVWKTLLKYIPNNQESRNIWNYRKSKSYFSTVSAQNMYQNPSDILKEYKASLRYVWRSSCVSEAIDTLLSTWLLGSTSSGKEDSDVEAESEIAKQLMPMFLIFKLHRNTLHEENEDGEMLLKILHDLFVDEEEILKRGRTVVVQSTPFGNSFFYNSISEGIVSSISGPKNCLILTDTRTAIGSEGGPIYAMRLRNGEIKRDLVGMVICSLCWWRGEWVGFTLGVSLMSALQDVQLVRPFQYTETPTPSCSSIKELGFLDECMVVVRCGPGWGSGVVIDSDKRIILTCSHVVSRAKNGKAQICWKNMKCHATILFRVRNNAAYDVAILKVETEFPFRPATLSSKVPVRGEPVIAAGFPLFSEEENSRPTLSRGIVAHVSKPLAMIQTTCCIQSGASGGALFGRTGEVVGLISCNTQDVSSKAHYPHINMAVPACVIVQPIQKFLRTGDTQHLNTLESPYTVVQRIWKMQDIPSKL